MSLYFVTKILELASSKHASKIARPTESQTSAKESVQITTNGTLVQVDAVVEIANHPSSLYDLEDELKELLIQLVRKSEEITLMREQIKHMSEQIDRLTRAVARISGVFPHDQEQADVQVDQQKDRETHIRAQHVIRR